MALQFSIEELIRRASVACRFYTLSIPYLMPWREVSKRHRHLLNLIALARARGTWPDYAGVRVFEEGDETDRPHAHWVFTPRLSQARIQHYATLANLGHVWLDFRPAGEYLGMYLSKYLSKQKNALRGIRRWSCFGEFSAETKVKDVEVTSPEIELFRSHMKACLAEGMGKTQAYTETVRRCNCSKYGVFAGKEQEPKPRGVSAEPENVRTDKTLVMNVIDKPGEMCIIKQDE